MSQNTNRFSVIYVHIEVFIGTCISMCKEIGPVGEKYAKSRLRLETAVREGGRESSVGPRPMSED